MASGRPYPNRTELLRFADLKFRSLTKNDWLEAFAHHPRIGDIEAVGRSKESNWSSEEQAHSLKSRPEILNELADMNQRYERRFGHIFLIDAAGLDTSEILARLKLRLRNDPYDELRTAGEHQRLITRSRLVKMLAELAEEVESSDAPVESTETEFLKARGRTAESEAKQKKKKSA